MYVTKGGGRGGGGKRDFEKKNIGSRIMRFQTNIGYANSKRWDMFLRK